MPRESPSRGFSYTHHRNRLGGVPWVGVVSGLGCHVKKAAAVVLQGAAWQRCRVHFMSNVLAVIPKNSGEMVASIIRTIFAQPDQKHVNAQFDEVARMLERSHRKSQACSPTPATTFSPSRPSRQELAPDLVHEPARARE